MHSQRPRFQNFSWCVRCQNPLETCTFGASFFHSKAFATDLKSYWKPCLYSPNIYFTVCLYWTFEFNLQFSFKVQWTVQILEDPMVQCIYYLMRQFIGQHHVYKKILTVREIKTLWRFCSPEPHGVTCVVTYINVQCKLKFLMALHNKKEIVHYIFNCSTLC